MNAQGICQWSAKSGSKGSSSLPQRDGCRGIGQHATGGNCSRTAGDGRFLPSLHIDLRYLGILKGWNFTSRKFVGSFDSFPVLFLFGFAFAKVNWPFDQSFNMTLPQERSFERYEELLVGRPKHPQHRIPHQELGMLRN